MNFLLTVRVEFPNDRLDYGCPGGHVTSPHWLTLTGAASEFSSFLNHLIGPFKSDSLFIRAHLGRKKKEKEKKIKMTFTFEHYNLFVNCLLLKGSRR